MKSKTILKIHFLAWLLLSFAFGLSYADVIKEAGTIESINGEAWASQENLPQRELSERSVVYVGDEITTGKNSSVVVLFKDKTTFQLGSEANFLITSFTYKKSEDEDGLGVKILKGTFRFVSGLIAKKKPKAMAVKTSVATIGIRGTHVAGEVEDTSARIVLMEKEDPTSANKIEVFNDFGSVTIDEAGYGTEIPDQYSPPSPVRRMRLQSINNLTRSIQRANTPRPRMR